MYIHAFLLILLDFFWCENYELSSNNQAFSLLSFDERQLAYLLLTRHWYDNMIDGALSETMRCTRLWFCWNGCCRDTKTYASIIPQPPFKTMDTGSGGKCQIGNCDFIVILYSSPLHYPSVKSIRHLCISNKA